jgi:hypothetical protein
MNLIANVAVIAILLTGPLPDDGVTSRDLPPAGETAIPRVAQAQDAVQPAPLLSTSQSGQRIAAFWIILPN